MHKYEGRLMSLVIISFMGFIVSLIGAVLISPPFRGRTYARAGIAEALLMVLLIALLMGHLIDT